MTAATSETVIRTGCRIIAVFCGYRNDCSANSKRGDQTTCRYRRNAAVIAPPGHILVCSIGRDIVVVSYSVFPTRIEVLDLFKVTPVTRITSGSVAFLEQLLKDSNTTAVLSKIIPVLIGNLFIGVPTSLG